MMVELNSFRCLCKCVVPYECFACCTSMQSYICIVAFHLDTIDEPREGCDVGAKAEDGEWWAHLEDGRMDPDVHDRRKMLAEQLSFN